MRLLLVWQILWCVRIPNDNEVYEISILGGGGGGSVCVVTSFWTFASWASAFFSLLLFFLPRT